MMQRNRKTIKTKCAAFAVPFFLLQPPLYIFWNYKIMTNFTTSEQQILSNMCAVYNKFI